MLRVIDVDGRQAFNPRITDDVRQLPQQESLPHAAPAVHEYGTALAGRVDSLRFLNDLVLFRYALDVARRPGDLHVTPPEAQARGKTGRVCRIDLRSRRL